MDELRGALAQLVADVRADPTQPQELARRFGLDKTLTWKIARVICDQDPRETAAHIPGRASVKALVDAMRRAGAKEHSATAVLGAMDRFEEVVQMHSGDRGTFEVMLGITSERHARKSAETARKQFFQGASAIWGVRARVQLSMHVVTPSSVAGKMDTAVVAGLMDFRRLRPDVSWTVASMATQTDDGTPQGHPDLTPIDTGVARTGPPLLRRFCSNPPPVLRSTPGPNGVTRHEFTEGPIGNTAAATCILGWVAKGELGRYRTPDDSFGEHVVRLNTPVELLYHDLYVHRSLEAATSARLYLHNGLPGAPVYPYDGRERSQLPLAEEMIDLGEAPPAATAPEIAEYRQMLETALEALGARLDEMRGFRLRMRFPPTPAFAIYRYALPEDPAQ